MSMVLDSSAALAWIYAQERTPAIMDVVQRLRTGGAWVPSLWRLEVANVLEIGVRRRRHGREFRDGSLADLELLPIQTDRDTERHAWGATLRIAERHNLTLYDAAYLELAMRRDLPLASLDQQLRTAALAERLTLLGK